MALLNPSLELEEMLTEVAQQLVTMFGVDHSGVVLFDDDHRAGVVVAEFPSQGNVGLRVQLTDYPIFDQLKQKQHPIGVIDAQHDPGMGNAQTIMQKLGITSIAIIPLIIGGKMIGSLSLDLIGETRQFAWQELSFYQVIGNQIAVAIDYTRALKTAEENYRQTQTLREINRILSESLDLDQSLILILEQLENVIPVDSSSIYLLDDDHIRLKAYRGENNTTYAKQNIPIDRLWGVSEIVKTRAPVLVNNTKDHQDWNRHTGQSIKSWLGAPLIANGELVGILNMNAFDPDQFDQNHIAQAMAFASQSALAIHNARLYGQATKRAELLASVHEIGVRIAASLDLKDILQAVISSVLTLLEAGQARIYLYDSETSSFTLAAFLAGTGQLQTKISRPRDDGVTATVARTGQLMTISDILGHPLYMHESGIHGFRGIASAPLKKRDKVLGVLNVFFSEPHDFSPEEIDALRLLSTQTAVAIENARLYELEVKQLEQEMHIARQIQQGFFPKQIPALPGWSIAAICQPARETGGDFYEFVERQDRELGVVIGDVSGKSIPAAMLMAGAHSVVRSKGSDHRSPAKVINETNQLLYDDVPRGSFVALSYALLAADSGDILLSSGGQLSPFLVPANGKPVTLVETPGVRLPLGVVPDLVYDEMHVSLAPGDTLVFHTDGLVEQHNAAGRLLGFDQITRLLEGMRGKPPEAVLRTLIRAGQLFAEGAGPHDDITLVVIQRTR